MSGSALPANGNGSTLTQAERSAISDKAMIDAAIDLILEHGTDGTTLQAVVVEVNNTPWGEQTSYVESCAQGRSDSRHWRFRVAKKMHVSPFMPMAVTYNWTLSAPGEQLSVFMANEVDGKRVFKASLALRREEISALSLASVLSRFPLQTARIVAAIHWQALCLWLKRVPLHTHPGKQHLLADKS